MEGGDGCVRGGHISKISSDSVEDALGDARKSICIPSASQTAFERSPDAAEQSKNKARTKQEHDALQFNSSSTLFSLLYQVYRKKKLSKILKSARRHLMTDTNEMDDLLYLVGKKVACVRSPKQEEF